MGSRIRVSKKLQYGRLATPQPDRHSPVYRWFLMKESFSGHLVKMLLDLWRPISGPVLDPFCGAGTTLLACKELGFESVGLERHPFLFLVSRVKTRDHSVEELESLRREILDRDFKPLEKEVPSLIRRAFPRGVLEDLMILRDRILELPDGPSRDFFRLALVRSALECSWVKKDGAVIRLSPRRVPPLQQVFKRVVDEMIEDVRVFPKTRAIPDVRFEDARRPSLPDSSAGAVITSPPYLFKGEYVREFSVEGWIADTPDPSPPSFVGGVDLDSPQAYFDDMKSVIEELYRICLPGAEVCVVVSDGGTRKGIVEVGPRLCESAGESGFKTKKMVIINERWCTTPSRRKIGILREYLLFWRKPS